jgi:hypothetical protein
MPRKTKAAQPHEAPASLADAVATKDRAQVLESLAAKLASAIDASASGRDTAALSKQLRDTLSELDAAGGLSAAVPEAIRKAIDNRRKQ